MSHYDFHGFVSDSPIPGRDAGMPAPSVDEWPAGMRPCWTGSAWVYAQYPVVDTPPVPLIITARQIRLALNQVGLRDAVEAAVAVGDRDLRDWWEFSTEVHRDNPMVIGMISALGVTPEQADTLWRLGATL